MFKFNNESEIWDKLTTTYKEEDDEYYYYDIELTSFSYFAISGALPEEGESDGQEGDQEVVQGDGQEGSPEGKTKSFWWIWVIVVVLLTVMGVAYYINKGHTKKL